MTKKINYFSQYSFLIVCLIFSSLFSLLSILRYQHFMTGSYDLSIFDQIIWHYSRFDAPVSTIREMNILGDHFSPVLSILSPLFWVYNDVRILLVFQATIVCLSAQLIYKILAKWLADFPSAFFISFSFFLFLGLQYSLDYDFHLVSLSVFPLSLVFFGLFLNKKFAYWAGIVVAFLLKEDLPIIVFFIGLYELLLLRRRRLGILTMFVSICSYLLITKTLMPLFRDNSSAVKNYIDFYGIGNTPSEMIRNFLHKPWIVLVEMFNSPVKINTFLLTLKSFAFLPFFSPLFWITSLPIWLERFLSNTSTRWQFEQYYGISLTPILVLACGQTILFLQKISSKFKRDRKITLRAFSLVVLGCSLIINKIYHAPLTRLIYPEYYLLSKTEKSLEELVKLVPLNSSVSAQQPIVSHLSHRNEIYWFPKKIQDVEYIALVKGRPTTPLSEVEFNKVFNQLLEDKNFETVFNKNDVFLFKKTIPNEKEL